jgi:hypothetical protein
MHMELLAILESLIRRTYFVKSKSINSLQTKEGLLGASQQYYIAYRGG